MKKMLIGMLVVFLMNCAGPYNQLGSKESIASFLSSLSVYHVIHEDHDQIGNSFFTDKVLFYQGWGFYISIIKYSHSNKTFDNYAIELTYLGPNWIFMGGSITIEADGQIFNIIDSTPAWSA
ncbi:MAG: hypothetical protein PHN44_04205 [Candidatus Marinimicrobia bacterium]|jgi:hypothetical protein|nr:hypothetical protein [Candidatus Neomarinimicrobiota bacterium]MDD5539511.1 hypothetical protein [Candidatus Neomarinimicrobiota bacterium]